MNHVQLQEGYSHPVQETSRSRSTMDGMEMAPNLSQIFLS
jgi:hypothetical protein